MSKRFRSQAFVLRQLELDLTKHEFRLSSSRPNPESSLIFLFVTLLERIDEKVNISRHLCLYLCGMALSL